MKIIDWEKKKSYCKCISVCRMPVKSFIKIGDMKVKAVSVWRGMILMDNVRYTRKLQIIGKTDFGFSGKREQGSGKM